MTSSRKQTIRARIAREAIAKVMQFFDGTLAQALHEILQNARRSGATAVAITRDQANTRITVSDDGRGIGDPTALLAFGRSGWPKDLHGAEHPAGMGFFSLARRSPRIRSRAARRAAWSVQLGEDHFVGRAPAAVAADPGWNRDHGTEVTFSVLPTDSCWIPTVIADAVRHYPIPVTVNGRRPEQTDFLEDAVRTETWRGLRVGVFHSSSPNWATPAVNFHGLHVAFSDLPRVQALPGADADAPRTWWTLADVIDCPDLELTLPTRTAIVQTPFTAELVSEATRIIYRAIAAAGQAPRLGYEIRTKAAAAGIALPADPRHLTPWEPKNARDAKPLNRPRHPDLQHAVLVDDDELDAAESQTLAWAAKECGSLGRYWDIESGLRGYRWYDELPCIVGVNIHMRSGTRTQTSTRQTRRNGESPFRGAVDEIELELLVKRPGCGAPGKVRIPTSAALLSPEGGGTIEIEPVFVTRRDAPIDRGALGSALAEAYFQPSFDSDADSIDTQLREYRRRIAYLVTELLESREAAADADLRELMATCILPSMSGESNVDIEIRNGALTAIRRI
ncbi:MAG: ATP-binding protein [Acidobacteria bacterium]|nr:ATP-binding protein [Acidobacteriota bacterium]